MLIKHSGLSLNWTLSSFYAFYFATIGAVIPYLSLYFESIGFSPQKIGLLMSVLLITKIIAPNFWGYMLDTFSSKYPKLTTSTTTLALLICGLAFMLLNVTKDFWWIVALVFLYSFFWNAVLPQMESLVYTHLGQNRHRYGRIRVWGSIGFIISVIGLGWVIENFGIEWLIPIVTMIFFVLAVHGLLIKQIPSISSEEQIQKPLKKIFTPTIMAVLFLGMITQMTHAPFYTFFSIYLESYGYSKTLIGILWALGVVVEIGVFLFAHLLFSRFNVFKLLVFCFAITALRWWMLSEFAESIILLVVAQSMHAISFGLYHASASQLINSQFTGQFQVRGQALYSSLTFGVGGAIGTFASGFLWSAYGGQTVFLLCAIMMAIATIFASIFTVFLRS